MDKRNFENLGQKMNLISDLFSRVVFSDVDACQDLIRIILGKNFLVKFVTTQKDITNMQFHSVVLDVLAVTENGTPVHIEFQIEDSDDHLRRVRYCNSSLDTHSLRPGQKYRELPDNYHIYISMRDFMKRGKTVYEILRIIKDEDDSEKDADNGVHELYVNLEVPPIGNKELASLLRYIRHTIPENEDSCFSHIVNSVNACRKEGMNMKYYNSKEFYEEGVKDGMENSQNSIIRNMLTENVTPEQISQYTRISLERIHQVQREMSQVVCETNAYHTANKITSH